MNIGEEEDPVEVPLPAHPGDVPAEDPQRGPEREPAEPEKVPA